MMKKIFSHAIKALVLLLVTAAVSPAGVAEDSAAQQVQTVLEAIRNSGKAPDACSLESFNEPGDRPDAKGVVDQGGACKNFYSYVCDSKRHEKRQKSVDRQVEAVILQTMIDTMTGEEKSDAQSALERFK